MSLVLSVLVCGTPRRLESHATPLIRKLEKQADGLPVEILYLLDNKKRSVGYKRQALLDIAKGDYVSYVDDDDDVADNYVSAILEGAKFGSDVVTFDQCADINGAVGLIRFGLGQPNEAFKPGGIALRGAWHVCAWKRSIAQTAKFPDLMDGEDWRWAEQLCLKATTSTHVDAVIHLYRFRSATTEATGMNK
jgi:glycosyltransferase involved in cell wall biosynthesis